MRLTKLIFVLIALISLILCGFANSYAVRTQEISDDVTAAPDNAELQQMIEKAVSQRIRPLQREIAELREETRFHDILGGIGYIVGIAGIVFYFLGVRRREGSERTNKAE